MLGVGSGDERWQCEAGLACVAVANAALAYAHAQTWACARSHKYLADDGLIITVTDLPHNPFTRRIADQGLRFDGPSIVHKHVRLLDSDAVHARP